MTTSTPRRAKNSLSRKKFLDRLNKGLPIFTAYGEHNFITRGDSCRDLHWVSWRFGSGGGGAEFVTVTQGYPSGDSKTHVALTDMNVERNGYNRNFVFRTQQAAERYLAEGM